MQQRLGRHEEARIADCVHRAKTLSPAEVIVVDGGSTDRTRELASPADRVLQTAPGRARQMNAGASIATGQVLLFLHADCWLELAGLQGRRLPDSVREAYLGL